MAGPAVLGASFVLGFAPLELDASNLPPKLSESVGAGSLESAGFDF